MDIVLQNVNATLFLKLANDFLEAVPLMFAVPSPCLEFMVSVVFLALFFLEMNLAFRHMYGSFMGLLGQALVWVFCGGLCGWPQ